MNQREKLDRYREILLTWDQKVNLLGPEARRNLDEHIAEALFAADALEPERECLDIGSGGGLPAIPIAIRTPECRMHLVDSDRRKWAFLKHVVRECSLNSVVHGDRLARVLSELDADLRFSLVTSRAVGRPREWVPQLLPWMEREGRIALFQSSPEPPDVAGLRLERTLRLPRGDRNFLVVLETFHVEQYG